MLINLQGCRCDHVSREQLRAFLVASVMVLSYHNCVPRLPLLVRVKRRLKKDTYLGQCFGSVIELRADLSIEDMLTTSVHEVIHSCITFPDGTVEACTTRLCAKIKPDVAKLAAILLDGTYRRAAYIAHTKMRYQAVNGDFYDPAENVPIGVTGRYPLERVGGPNSPSGIIIEDGTVLADRQPGPPTEATPRYGAKALSMLDEPDEVS